ncbi:MAG: hypothetical protein IT343_07890, partial [Candidatus Melainabacteria bacterium]|nr:hypothetical protein [Candidatus Melainabacteria bacterium]
EPVSRRLSDDEDEDEDKPLFDANLDSDVDDIFKSLAPEEAQREVSGAAAVDKTPPPPPQEEEEKADLDEIFARAREEAAKDPAKDISFEPAAAKAPPQEKAEKPLPSRRLEDDEDEDKPLFEGGVDDDIEEIFSNLAPEEAQREVVKPALEAEKPTDTGELEVIHAQKDKPAPQPPPQPAPATATASDLDRPVKETAMFAKPDLEPKPPLGPDGKPIKELKEFGRLSGKSAAEPATSADAVGTMKTVGKLLLDVSVVESIIKAEEEQRTIGANLATARVISAARGEGIQSLLNHIDTFPNVYGSLIVGHDGLVIAASTRSDMDKDTLGVLSTALLSTSNLGTNKLEIGKLRQMVLLTDLKGELKVTVLTDVDVGILAVFADQFEIGGLDRLIESIQETING